jgi:RimJ/RimL family protein N-acetyltransferase
MPNTDLFRGKLVRLAAPQPEDNAAFAQWSNDSEYMRQLDTDYIYPRNAASMQESQARHNDPSHGVVFNIRTLDDDRLIGFVAIHSIEWNNQAGLIAIGIGVPEYRGKGYGGDALRLVLNYGFNELGLYRIGLEVIGSNARAMRAYEKVGFIKEGVKRACVFRDGQRTDVVVMGILRDDWQLKK